MTFYDFEENSIYEVFAYACHHIHAPDFKEKTYVILCTRESFLHFSFMIFF